MMSGSIHQTSIHWSIRFGGNAGVLTTKAATEAKTSCRVFKCTLVKLVCVTIDYSVKDYHKRLQYMCQPKMDILNIYCHIHLA